MFNTDLRDILKEGATGKFADVDYSTPEKREELRLLKEKQNEILSHEQIDRDRLRNFTFRQPS